MSPTAIATSLEGFDFDAATEGELAQAGDLVQRLRGFLNAVDGKIARRATDLHGQGQCIPPDDLISRSQKSSRREAGRSRRLPG